MRAKNQKHCFAWAANTQHGILQRPVWKKIQKKPLFDTTTVQSKPEVVEEISQLSMDEQAAQTLKEKIDSQN